MNSIQSINQVSNKTQNFYNNDQYESTYISKANIQSPHQNCSGQHSPPSSNEKSSSSNSSSSSTYYQPKSKNSSQYLEKSTSNNNPTPPQSTNGFKQPLRNLSPSTSSIGSNGQPQMTLAQRESQNKPPQSTPLQYLLQNPSNSVVQHLDIMNFKSKPCTASSQHNHKHCSFFHNSKDRKRLGDFYSSDLCEYVEKGLNCPYGDVCRFAHNRVEQLYQPGKYKTKFCTFYPNNLKNCEYGQYCSFAHSEEDILIELIHNYEQDDDFYMFYFKTEWCPYNLIPHDKGQCVYAHNWQDFRRRLMDVHYETVTCPNWRVTEFISNYQEGCRYKFDCEKCHGWKEMEYHPRIYKTKSCPNGNNCQKGRDCPNFHSNQDRRIIPQGIINQVFMFVPKNRALDQMVNPDTKKVNLIPIKGNQIVVPLQEKALSSLDWKLSSQKLSTASDEGSTNSTTNFFTSPVIQKVLIENYSQTPEEKKASQTRKRDLTEFFKKFNLEQNDNYNDSPSDYRSRKLSNSSFENELQSTINLLYEN